MNKKQLRKLKQFYKDDIKEHINLFANAIRPKPRFMPHWVWKKIVYRVLKV